MRFGIYRDPRTSEVDSEHATLLEAISHPATRKAEIIANGVMQAFASPALVGAPGTYYWELTEAGKKNLGGA